MPDINTQYPTSSRTGTFNFAYGSNLSPYQVSLRLQHSPSSSIPVAVARLDWYEWIICSRGYGNIVAVDPSSSLSPSPPSPPTTHPNPATTVYGLIYNLSAEDESTLDEYEGHDKVRNPNPTPNPDSSDIARKPYLQGNWDYNKLYVPVTITRWLQDPKDYGVILPSGTTTTTTTTTTTNTTGSNATTPLPDVVTVSVYVDELRTQPGEISFEYIGRMNRAIRESVQLGLPEDWVESVMRKFVPKGIEVQTQNYIGDRDGYIEERDGKAASGQAV